LWISIAIDSYDIFFKSAEEYGLSYLAVDSEKYLNLSIEDYRSFNLLGMGTNYLPILIGDFSQWVNPEKPYLTIFES
jgi:hypothetical protein